MTSTYLDRTSFFMDCKDLTMDPYWQEIFEQCSMGKYPRGMSVIQNDTICIVSGNGKNKEMISMDGDYFEIFKTLLRMFREKLGMMSERDAKKQKQEISELKESLRKGYEGSWKQIKAKKIRNALLLDFVIDCKNKYNLSQQDTNNLFSMIKLGFIFKSITSDNIEYQDGIIQNIQGLEFFEGTSSDQSKFSFNYLNSKEDLHKIEKNLADVNKISTTVERYIKDYKLQVIDLSS